MNATTTLTIATETPSAVATAAIAFDRSHEEFLAACREDADEAKIGNLGGVASKAFHALLAVPATSLADTARKLIAVATWSAGSVIENEEVEGIAAEMARILGGEA